MVEDGDGDVVVIRFRRLVCDVYGEESLVHPSDVVEKALKRFASRFGVAGVYKPTEMR